MNEAIYNALIAHIKAVPGMFPMQSENTVLDTVNKPWARATTIYARPNTASIGKGGYDQHNGILQVDLFVQLNTGTLAANAMATKIVDSFPRGTSFVVEGKRVHVLKAHRVTSTRLNDKYHCVPVAIEWRVNA